MIALGIVAIATVAFAAEQWLPSSPRKPTNHAEAHELFLRAQEYESRMWAMHEWNPEWQKAAETLYRRALTLDPGFALARAELADMLAIRQFDVRHRSPAGLEAVRREAEAALRLQPNLGEAHLVMSFYWDMRGEYERALEEAERARKASPGNAEMHGQVGSIYFKLGRWDDAVAAYRQGVKLDAKRRVQLAGIYARLRRHEQAARTYDQYLMLAPDDYAVMIIKGFLFWRWRGSTDTLSAAVRRLPNGWDPNGVATLARVIVERTERRPAEALKALAKSRHAFIIIHTNIYEPISLIRAAVYSQAGDSVRAAAEYETARGILADSVAATPDKSHRRIALAKALAGLGQRSQALRETEAALALVPGSSSATVGPELLAGAATVFAMLHENDRAIHLLDQLLKDPSAGLYVTRALLRVEPAWDPLRDDPRFQRLLVQ